MQQKSELVEFRAVLENWQNHPPRVILSVFIRMSEIQVTYEQIVQARLYKFIKDIAQADIKLLPLLYSKNDYESVQEQAKTILKVIRDMTQGTTGKSAQVTPELKRTPSSTINLFENYVEPTTGYTQRGPVLNGVARAILLNFQNANGDGDVTKQNLDRIKEVTLGLEKEFYFRNQHKTNSKANYQSDVKTLIQFLKKDKNGAVTMSLLLNQFPIKKAAELKSQDWMDDDTRKKQQEIQKQDLLAAQTGFYEDLKKREMGKAQGKECRRCHNESVYLIEEKQTRCSDEPTTKFYECFNCNDKFRQN